MAENGQLSDALPVRTPDLLSERMDEIGQALPVRTPDLLSERADEIGRAQRMVRLYGGQGDRTGSAIDQAAATGQPWQMVLGQDDQQRVTEQTARFLETGSWGDQKINPLLLYKVVHDPRYAAGLDLTDFKKVNRAINTLQFARDINARNAGYYLRGERADEVAAARARYYGGEIPEYRREAELRAAGFTLQGNGRYLYHGREYDRPVLDVWVDRPVVLEKLQKAFDAAMKPLEDRAAALRRKRAETPWWQRALGGFTVNPEADVPGAQALAESLNPKLRREMQSLGISELPIFDGTPFTPERYHAIQSAALVQQYLAKVMGTGKLPELDDIGRARLLADASRYFGRSVADADLSLLERGTAREFYDLTRAAADGYGMVSFAEKAIEQAEIRDYQERRDKGTLTYAEDMEFQQRKLRDLVVGNIEKEFEWEAAESVVTSIRWGLELGLTAGAVKGATGALAHGIKWDVAKTLPWWAVEHMPKWAVKGLPALAGRGFGAAVARTAVQEAVRLPFYSAKLAGEVWDDTAGKFKIDRSSDGSLGVKFTEEDALTVGQALLKRATMQFASQFAERGGGAFQYIRPLRWLSKVDSFSAETKSRLGRGFLATLFGSIPKNKATNFAGVLARALRAGNFHGFPGELFEEQLEKWFNWGATLVGRGLGVRGLASINEDKAWMSGDELKLTALSLGITSGVFGSLAAVGSFKRTRDTAVAVEALKMAGNILHEGKSPGSRELAADGAAAAAADTAEMTWLHLPANDLYAFFQWNPGAADQLGYSAQDMEELKQRAADNGVETVYAPDVVGKVLDATARNELLDMVLDGPEGVGITKIDSDILQERVVKFDPADAEAANAAFQKIEQELRDEQAYREELVTELGLDAELNLDVNRGAGEAKLSFTLLDSQLERAGRPALERRAEATIMLRLVDALVAAEARKSGTTKQEALNKLLNGHWPNIRKTKLKDFQRILAEELAAAATKLRGPEPPEGAEKAAAPEAATPAATETTDARSARIAAIPGEVYSKWLPLVQQRVARFVADPRAVEAGTTDADAAQDYALDALAKVAATFKFDVERAQGRSEEQAFESALNTAITNSLKDYYRAAKTRRVRTGGVDIDAPVAEGEKATVAEVIPDAGAATAEEIAAEADLRKVIAAGVREALTSREQLIYDAIVNGGRTQTDIAADLNVTASAVSAAWKNARAKLRAYLAEKGVPVDFQNVNNKKADELFTGFRDLARGLHLDDKSSEAAVRQSIQNMPSLDANVKRDLLEIFDVWAGRKKAPWGRSPVTPRTFVTDMTAVGFTRIGKSASAYRTVDGNTVRLSYHSSSMKTFAENGESGNVVSVVIEKQAVHKPFRNDPSVNGVEYVFPADEVTHGQIGVIIHDIAQFFATGEYFDHAGARHTHVSGSEEFKKNAQERIDANIAGRERLYNEVGASMQMIPDNTFGAFDRISKAIHLFEKANATTFPHETMHWFLDLLKDLDARGVLDGTRYKEDLRKLIEYATDKDGEYDEEKIVKAWDYYLRKGVAPEKSGLQTAFNILKDLLKAAYKVMSHYFGRDFELAPEIQDIFDGWLASDYQAQEELGSNPLLQLLLQYKALKGMGNADRSMIKKIGEQLLAATAEELDKRKTEARREAYRNARREVESLADEQQVYKIASIAARLAGINAADVEARGGDLAELLKLHGVEVRADDGKGETAPAALAQVAEEAGYDSVEEMIEDMRNSIARPVWVRREVQKRMGQWESGYPVSDAALTADETLTRIEQLIADVSQHVSKEQAPLNREAFFAEARKRLATMPVAQALRLDRTRAAVKRNARDAVKALQAEKYDEAIKAIGNVYTLTALAREQQNFRDLVEKAQRFAGRLRRMKNVEGDIHWFARKLAANYRLSNDLMMRVAAPAEGKTLRGVLLDVGLDIADTELPEVKDYRNLTVEEFNQVAQMLRTLISVGRDMASEGRKNWRARCDAEAAEIMGADISDAPATAGDESLGVRAKSAWHKWRGWNRTLLSFCRKLGGGQNVQGRGSPAAPEKYIYIPYARAAETEYLLRKRAVDMAKEPMRYLFERLNGIDLRQADLPAPNDERARVSNRNWTAESVLSIILNSGNSDNLGKLVRGEGFEAGDIDRFRRIFDRKEDWDAIQKLWDALDSLFDAVDRAFYRANYQHLYKEEATSFEVTLAGGSTMTVRGGYMPLSYDGRLSFGPGGADSFGNLQGGRGGQGTQLGGSFTHVRQDNVQKVVDLSLAGFAKHIDEAAHYAAFKDLSRKISYLMNRGDFKKYLSHKLGGELDYFKDALREPINQEPLRWHPVFEFLRRCAINLGLWGNLHVWVQQFSTARVGAHLAGERYYWNAVTRFVSAPKYWIDWVNNISPLMAQRFEGKDADIRRAITELASPEWKRRWNGAVAAGFAPIRIADAAAVYPVFIAMYDRAIADGKSQRDAADAAYTLIAATQGTGLEMDKSAAQRGSFGKAFMMFAGPTVALHNHVMDLIANRDQLTTGEFAGSLFDSVVFPVLINVMIDSFFYGMIRQLFSRDPREREKAVRRILASFGAEALGSLFMAGTPLRELPGIAGAMIEGKARRGGLFRTPVGRVPDMGVDIFMSASRGNWNKATWDAAEVLTGLTGVPLGTVVRRFEKFGKDWGIIEDSKPKRR